MKVKSIAECSKGSILQYFNEGQSIAECCILQYFWPSLSHQLSFRSLFCVFWVAILHRFYCTWSKGSNKTAYLPMLIWVFNALSCGKTMYDGPYNQSDYKRVNSVKQFSVINSVINILLSGIFWVLRDWNSAPFPMEFRWLFSKFWKKSLSSKKFFFLKIGIFIQSTHTSYMVRQ